MSAACFIRRILAVLLLPVLVPSLSGLSVKQLSQEQILSRAECVFVGTVTAKRSRWRRPGQMTETIYTVRVHDVLRNFGKVFPKLQSDGEVELACAGGVADNQGIWITGVPTFEIGQKAVFFCDKDGGEHLSALVGTSLGFVPVNRQNSSTQQRTTASLSSGDSSEWVPVTRSLDGADNPDGQSLVGFLDDLRRVLAQVDKGLADSGAVGSAVDEGYGASVVELPRVTSDRQPAWQSDPDKVLPSLFVPLSWDLHGIGGPFSEFGREFIKATDAWDAYASVFGISSVVNVVDFFNPSAYGMLNFKNDVVLTDTATLKDKWGVDKTFEDQGQVFMAFGINNFNILNSLADVDLIFNSAVDWTDDIDEALNNSSKVYFRSTAVHALGLAMGRVHQYEESPPFNGRMSVMNHFDDAIHPHMSHPFLDDALSIRSLYPDQVQQVADLGVTLFKTSDVVRSGDNGVEVVHLNSALSSTFLGDNISVDVRLENLGTVPLAPTLAYFLTQSPSRLVGAVRLGTRSYLDSQPSTYSDLTQEVFKIPDDPRLVGKDHYLAVRIENENEDDIEANNLAIGVQPITVRDSTNIRFRTPTFEGDFDPSTNVVTIGPGERRRVSTDGFRHNGPASWVRWEIDSNRPFVIPASSGGILRADDPSFVTADYHVDATGLAPGTYFATNWLRLNPGTPIPMPVKVIVAGPSLDFFPEATSDLEHRLVTAYLGEEFVISQVVKNKNSTRVPYNVVLDPPGREYGEVIYGFDREISRFSVPEYSGAYPGPGYHPNWVIRITGDYLAPRQIYRPVRIIAPFSLSRNYFQVGLGPFGELPVKVWLRNDGRRSLEFDVSEKSRRIDLDSRSKKLLVLPGEQNRRAVVFKVNARGFWERDQPYRDQIKLVTTVKNTRTEPHLQSQWQVVSNITVDLKVGTPMVKVVSPANSVIPNGVDPESPNPYNFGQVEVGESKSLSFRIDNDGDIIVDNLRVEVLPTSHLGSEVHFTGQQLRGYLLPKGYRTGSSTRFWVNFSPKTTGDILTEVRVFRATRPRESLHRFYVQGTGVGTAKMQVRRNGQIIPNGAAASATYGTDFGSVTAFVSTTQTFTIENIGNAPLELSSVPPVFMAPNGPGPMRFVAAFNQGTTIQPGGSVNFDVTFTPEYQDISRARVIIPSTNGTYHIPVRGRGLTPGMAPTANIDFTNTVHRTSVIVDVLGNDSSPDGDPLTIADISELNYGTAVLGNGKIVYTPPDGFIGTGHFRYLMTDGRDGTSEASVFITVGLVATNNLGAVDDVVSGASGEEIQIDVLNNDRFNPGAFIELLGSPAKGEATADEAGLVSYRSTNLTELLPFTDQFAYRLTEDSTNAPLTSTGMVTVTISEPAQFDWVRTSGSNGLTRATALAVDAEGHAHAAGYYHVSAAKFGSITLPLSDNGSLVRNLFLVQYDNAGNQQSAVRIGESPDADIVGLGIDGAGNRYIAGRFEGSIQLGTFTLDSGASTHGVYLGKIDSNGSVLWARLLGRGSSSLTTVRDFAVDAAGNSCVVGRFNNPDFSDIGIIAVRYDSSGLRDWAREADHLGLGSNPIGTGVAADANGNFVVVGSFGGTLKFHTDQQISSQGGDDIFLAQYTPVGGLAWFRRLGGSANERPTALDLDDYDRIFLSGTYDGVTSIGGTNLTHVSGLDGFVARLTTNGVLRWIKSATGTGDITPTDLAVIRNGAVSVAYEYFGALNIAGVILNSAGARDVGAARYNSEGTLHWATPVVSGTRTDEYGRAVGMDPAGNVLVLGDLVEATINGQNHVAAGSGSDLYLAKIGQRPVAGRLAFVPGEMYFGLDTIRIESDTLTLTNFGPRPLTWSVSSTNDWLFASPMNGTIPVNGSTNLAITVHPTNTALGLHVGHVLLQSSDPTRTTAEVPVTLILENPPVLAFSPPELHQIIKPTNSLPPQTIEIWNTGGEALDFTVASDVAWITLSTNSGIVTNQRETIELSFDVGALGEGRHFGNLTITGNSANSPATIPLSLTISRFDIGNGNALDEWSNNNPLVPSYDFYGVASGPSGFVAVGEFGTAVLSADGTNWQTFHVGTNVTLRGVAAGNGGYIAVGDGGTILHSTDGRNWNARVSGTSQSLHAVGFANGVMVAVGNGGTILTSTDATFTTWQARSSPVTVRLNGVDHGNGMFLVTGQSGSLLTSVDGGSWTAVNLQNFAEYRAAIHVAGAYYVAGDQWLTSTDMVQWSVPNLGLGPSETVALAVHAGQLVAAGGDALNDTFSTHQGSVAWTSASSPGTLNRLNLPEKRTNLRGLAGNGTNIVAVGYSGRILTSPDGMNWTDQNPLSLPNLEGITSGPGQLVAVGRSGALLSTSDGTNWTRRLTPNNSKDDVWDVTHGAGVYLAATARGAWWSSNAVDWVYQFWGASLSTPRVAFGNGRFVVVSAAIGAIRSSTNTIDWPLRYSGTSSERHRAVDFGDGRFVAVGDSGRIMMSTNGIDWSFSTSGVTDRLRGVAFGNDTWVAVGNGGRILTSTDGVAWNIENSGTTENLLHVTYGAGGFLAIGKSLFVSPDGKTWAVHSRGNLLTFYAAEIHENRFYLVGQRGSILRSGELDRSPPIVSFAAATNRVIESQGLAPSGLTPAGTMSLRLSPSGLPAAGTISIPVVRSGKLDVPVSVDFRTINGLATAGTDFTTNSGTLHFAAGQASKTITITVVNDDIPEGEQEFFILLENAGGGAFLEGITQTRIVIDDDDIGAPRIIIHPVNAAVFAGGTAEFRVAADGEGVLNYQWQKDGIDLTGRTNTTLTLPSVTPGSAGSYRAAVSNTNGTVFSASAMLSVHPALDIMSLMQPSGAFDSEGDFRLRINSLNGVRITIEGSEDLTNWFRLHTLLSDTNTIEFDDPFGNQRPRRFYRVLRE